MTSAIIDWVGFSHIKSVEKDRKGQYQRSFYTGTGVASTIS